MRSRVKAVLVTLVICGACPASSQAYTYETSFSSGCHEALSWETLRVIRKHGLAQPRRASDSDKAIITDVQFDVPEDMRDIDAVALVLGNRDNDVKGLSGLDPKDLAEVHGKDAFQAEHCLRRSEHNGEAGSVEALRECRAFVRTQALRAISTLDLQGEPNTAAIEKLYVFFDFSGQREVELPAFYIHAGRALHTLQDSFAHTLRAPDDLRKVVSVLNWVDEVEQSREDARDGAPHLAALDDCESTDPRVQARYDMASVASIEFLQALLEPATPEQKMERVDVLLDTYLQHTSGCDSSNDWCSAPELEVAEDAASCATNAHSGKAFMLLLLLAAVLRRSRRATLLAGLLGLALTSSARAQDNGSDRVAFGASTRAAVSIDRGGGGLGAGGRLAIDADWWVGLDFEWNPWFSLATLRTRPGTFNVYGALIWRWHHAEALSLRTTGRLGVSTLLFDLVGAPSGSVGPCLGLNLLGVDLPISDRVFFVVDPAEVLVAIPQAQGAPIAYIQYRLALGFVFF